MNLHKDLLFNKGKQLFHFWRSDTVGSTYDYYEYVLNSATLILRVNKSNQEISYWQGQQDRNIVWAQRASKTYFYNANYQITTNSFSGQLELINSKHSAINTYSMTHNLILADDGAFVNMTNSIAASIHIPTNNDVAFPIGTKISICRGGVGTVNFYGFSGVTILSANNFNSIVEQYDVVELIKIGINTWQLMGNIEDPDTFAIEINVPTNGASFSLPLGSTGTYDFTVDWGDEDREEEVLVGGTASASTTYNGYVPSNACDGDINSMWVSGYPSDVLPQWWKYDLGVGVAKVVSKMHLLPYYNSSLGSFIRDFVLEGSNDDSNWDTLYTGEHGNNGDSEGYEFDNDVAYRYYRITITSSYTGYGHTGIADIRLEKQISSIDNITVYNDPKTTHTYGAAGSYIISIVGTMTQWIGWSVGDSSAAMVTAVLDVVDLGFIELSFGNCVNLTSVIYKLGNLSNLLECFMFNGCSSLTTIPTGIFDNNPHIESFAMCFTGCTSLTTIPADLFKYNTEVINFNMTFAGSGITSAGLPANLFKYNTAVTEFWGTFMGCQGITTVPADIFKYNTLVTNFEYTFCFSALSAIPTDLLRYNTAATSLYGTFMNTNITSVTTNAFQYNTLVTNMKWVLAQCAGLTSIPAHLFDTNTLVENFAGALGWLGITSIPTDLFKYNTAVTDFSWVFAYNLFLVNALNGNMFQYNTLVENFSYAFWNCNGITGSGWSTLISNAEGNVPTVVGSDCFDNCYSLTDYLTIPAGWMTPSVPTAPGAPTDLIATEISSTEVDLDWAEPFNGGSPITGYKIERESPIGGGFEILVADTGNTDITYQDDTVSSGTLENILTGGTPSASSTHAVGQEPDKACDGNLATRWHSYAGASLPQWWKYDLAPQDILVGGTASCSSSEPSGPYTADRACDDNYSTMWVSNSGLLFPCWWKYDLGVGVAKKVISLTIKPYFSSYGSHIKDFVLAGSNNDSNWTTIYTGQHANVLDEETYIFTNDTAYRYYRITITSNWVGSGTPWEHAGIIEVQMKTSTSAEKIATSLRLKPDYDIVWGSFIKDFVLAGSNDDSNWTTLYTGQHGNNGDYETFNFVNDVAYRYYRITISSSNWDGSSHTAIVEIELNAGSVGTEYNYRVSAINAIGTGDASNEADVIVS